MLPSGDRLVAWRLVVDRRPSRRPPEGIRRPRSTHAGLRAWAALPRRTAKALLEGDVVEVHEVLRRRFWWAGAGAASRCEVEVTAVRRVSRRPRPA